MLFQIVLSKLIWWGGNQSTRKEQRILRSRMPNSYGIYYWKLALHVQSFLLSLVRKELLKY